MPVIQTDNGPRIEGELSEAEMKDIKQCYGSILLTWANLPNKMDPNEPKVTDVKDAYKAMVGDDDEMHFAFIQMALASHVSKNEDRRIAGLPVPNTHQEELIEQYNKERKDLQRDLGWRMANMSKANLEKLLAYAGELLKDDGLAEAMKMSQRDADAYIMGLLDG